MGVEERRDWAGTVESKAAAAGAAARFGIAEERDPTEIKAAQEATGTAHGEDGKLQTISQCGGRRALQTSPQIGPLNDLTVAARERAGRRCDNIPPADEESADGPRLSEPETTHPLRVTAEHLNTRLALPREVTSGTASPAR
ncbi:unnamed protein product [Lampetra planeri]